MVEGLNAGLLAHSERMNNLIGPGSVLLFLGIMMPVLIEEVNDFTGRFTIGELNVFNGFLSIVLMLGLALVAYGITYRRKGDILLPIAFCLILVCSIDLLSWIYFVRLNWTPVPSSIFILPLAPPGYIPLILTIFFFLLIILARISYSLDPRSRGFPKYSK